MSEKERLQDLLDYKILDTAPDLELDELVEIASAICNTPISLISLVDDKRQWFKAKKGIEAEETDRNDAFCRYSFDKPHEVLVVEDSLKDERFSSNPLVLGNPNIRFYAGAPLLTPKGNVLGNLCILDKQPRKITNSQQRALQLLAKKTMDNLNNRKKLVAQDKKIEASISRLKKLTNQSPGTIYQFEMDPEGRYRFTFISEGISEVHPSLNPELLKSDAGNVFKVVHPEDLDYVLESIKISAEELSIWDVEYRVLLNGKISWQRGISRPEKLKDGTIVWYGMFQNINRIKQYEQALEQISFDISHILRRPITTIQGLTDIIQQEKLDEKSFKQYSALIKEVSEELDVFTRRLHATYAEKHKQIGRR
ncbi:GAF domain-containing protein [Autumnicola musiva]|uniref:histidine kinase n=1 Tax=Autumnicola musiva TaxID=3075589 RepID=A0ABU3D140_9FLAO|nr:GAF domain-containing protein [Zunongwangia sp. F117]MDT0675189.1 GAF domain-containing protein [Zunongwangia sp. F117]